MQLSPSSYNRRLLWYVLVVGAVLAIRLLGATLSSANWQGFIYSALHVLVVGFATYLALRRAMSSEKSSLGHKAE